MGRGIFTANTGLVRTRVMRLVDMRLSCNVYTCTSATNYTPQYSRRRPYSRRPPVAGTCNFVWIYVNAVLLLILGGGHCSYWM